MLDAIRSFLVEATEAVPTSTERLARCLDALALAYADTPICLPSNDDREPPSPTYVTTKQLVQERFPQFGFYAVADPLILPPEVALVADAADDVADMVADLSEVLWRNDNIGLAEAQWHFRFSYETHWGRHLHNLRSYLHETRQYLGF